MVKLFVGPKGSGKTKKLIEMANEIRKTARGSVVFVNKDSRLMCNLHYSIRLLNIQDYEIENVDNYIGFLYGILSSDHDIEFIFIDSLLRHTNINMENVPSFLEKLTKISEKYGMDFIVSISSRLEDLPEEIKRYDILK
ncbi:MAG: hypothetical protein WC996_05355 [Peptostreptococcales bacterium]